MLVFVCRRRSSGISNRKKCKSTKQSRGRERERVKKYGRIVEKHLKLFLLVFISFVDIKLQTKKTLLQCNCKRNEKWLFIY